MKISNFARAVAAASPFAMLTAPAIAATAHNSQAGSYGPSSNAGGSTPSSPRVKHSAKHPPVIDRQ